jgi:hypothetical protein
MMEFALGIISNGMGLVQRLPEDKQTVEWLSAAREWLDDFVVKVRSAESRVEYAVLWESGDTTYFKSIRSAQAYIEFCINREGNEEHARMRGMLGDPWKAQAVERAISVWPDPALQSKDWARYVGAWHVPRVDGPCCELAREPSPAVP